VPHEFVKRLDNQVNPLGRADGHAQTLRQSVPSDFPHDDPARSHERVGGVSDLDRLQVDQNKICLAGPDPQTGGFDGGRQSWPLNGVVLAAGFNPSWLSQGGDGGGLSRDRHVERAAPPDEHIDHSRGGVAPADSHAAQAVDLGESARHDGIVGCVHQLHAGIIIRVRDVLGIGRVKHQKHLRRQGGTEPGDGFGGHHRAGRVVRVGQEHQPRCG